MRAGFFCMLDLFTDTWKYNADYHRAADFFGINEFDRKDQSVAEKISKLIDSVSSRVNAKNLNEVLLNIHNIRKELGTNTTGKTLLNEVYQFNAIKEDTIMEEKERVSSEKELKEMIKESEPEEPVEAKEEDAKP